MTYPVPRDDALKLRLAMARPMTSLVDRAILSDGPHLKRVTENWVPCWVDLGHRVQGDDPKVHAARAIDDMGRLLWMVYQAGKRHAFHSVQSDPFAAMDEAAASRALRRQVRSDWDTVLKLRRAALLGQTRFRVHIRDAAAGGLCALGTEWFMRRMRLSGVEELSARQTALLGLADRQVLHVLYAAACRQGILGQALAAPSFAPAAPT